MAFIFFIFLLDSSSAVIFTEEIAAGRTTIMVMLIAPCSDRYRLYIIFLSVVLLSSLYILPCVVARQQPRKGSRDFYKILNIDRDASTSEIKSAYRKMAMTSHPDKHPNDKEAAARFQDIRAGMTRLLFELSL